MKSTAERRRYRRGDLARPWVRRSRPWLSAVRRRLRARPKSASIA